MLTSLLPLPFTDNNNSTDDNNDEKRRETNKRGGRVRPRKVRLGHEDGSA